MTRAIQAHAASAFRKQLLTDCGCLILDNIELLKGKAATQELTVQVIEELAVAGKRTLAGCSGDIYALPYFLGRVRESFPARRLIAVPPLNEEGKLELVNRYCRELGLELTEEMNLPSNRSITKQYARIEVFPWSSLKSYALVSDPKLFPKRLDKLARDSKNVTVVNSLLVRLRFADGTSAGIPVIPTPVRSSSFTCRQGYTVALELTNALEEVLGVQYVFAAQDAQ